MLNLGERRVELDNGINRTYVGLAPRKSKVGSLPSAGDAVFNPSVTITPGERVKRLGMGCHWWFSDNVHIPTGSKIEFRFRGPTHLLALYIQGTRKNGETSVGPHSSRLRSFVRKLTFVPAGCAYREWHETGASTRVTFLHLHPAAFETSRDYEEGLLPRIYFEDSLVWETGLKLRNAIESGQVRCMPYLKALSGVLAHELSRVNEVTLRGTAISRGGLAGWQKRTVADFVEEHLVEPIALPKLAELAQLSVHHFCRAFKQSFGLPPHQYQMQRRMEIAKLLLADPTTSITDIAFNLGYAQISSFSCAFRKATGWTPSVYRREFKQSD